MGTEAEKVINALRKIAPQAYMTRTESSWWDNPADENDDASADTVEFDGRFKVADLEAALAVEQGAASRLGEQTAVKQMAAWNTEALEQCIDNALAEYVTEGYAPPISYEDGPALAKFIAERIMMQGLLRNA